MFDNNFKNSAVNLYNIIKKNFDKRSIVKIRCTLANIKKLGKNRKDKNNKITRWKKIL